MKIDFKPLTKTCYRMVELQALSSTRVLVKNSYAHDRLEKLLDNHKPTFNLLPEEKKCLSMHYLLLTPFRYPPLKHGSRFGAKFERGIFYGSLDIATTVVEKAFYRISFAKACAGDIGNKNLGYTSFAAKINTKFGFDLTNDKKVLSKQSYDYSQKIGASLREAKVEAFLVNSARTKNTSVNLNVFSPLAFIAKQKIEKTFVQWSCFYNKTSAEFYQTQTPAEKIILRDQDFFAKDIFPGVPN